MKRFVWFIPHANGVAVGLILLACNGFDVSKVAGAWLLIAVVLTLYSLAIRGIPVSHPPVRNTRELERTEVQAHYLNALRLHPDKGV